MNYKYISSSSLEPHYNLALENYLFDFVNDDEVILFLWQNDNTIVIGRNQVVENECKKEDFLASGGTIVRRMSGGGAVYHDLGNLNYSLISKSKEKDRVIFHKIVADMLKSFSIETDFNGRNDILAGGRKFSGNAFYDNGTVYCQHGTLLVNSNIDRMTYFLTPDEKKLKRNGVKSVSSRVVNLSELKDSITVEQLFKSLIITSDAIPLGLKIDDVEINRRKSLFGIDGGRG